MAMVTSTSEHLSGALSSENNNHLLDTSFSSYINFSEERLVLKPPEESRSPNSTISLQQYEHLQYLGRNKVEDGEIGVFGAEKYFSGRMDEENPRIKTNGEINSHIDEQADNTVPAKPKIQGRTPSVHSESSWNSQSALLLSALRNPTRRKTNKKRGRNLLASLGCSCLDKNSVNIDEHAGYQINSKGSSSCGTVRTQTVAAKEPVLQNGLDTVAVAQTNKSRLDNPWLAEEMSCKKIEEMGLGLKREDYFSFPILNSKLGNLAVKLRLEGKENDDDDKQRKSLEVFGSPVLQKKKESSSLERRFTMLEEAEIPGMYVNDTASDASSDLFEIESFTNNSTSNSNNPFLQRQASDGMSSCVTQTTHYAPSEASIEWSVVTASAADFSVVSDSEDPIYSSSAKPQKTARNANKCNEMEKRHSGIMLGCKSQKAVRVVEDAYRTNGKAFPEQPRRYHRSECFLPGTRFQTKTTGL